MPLGIFTALALLVVGWALLDRNSLLKLGVNADFLMVLVVALPLVALAWLAFGSWVFRKLEPAILKEI